MEIEEGKKCNFLQGYFVVPSRVVEEGFESDFFGLYELFVDRYDHAERRKFSRKKKKKKHVK